MVTLKDIAQKAGVSSMTVSRVMNGKHLSVSKRLQKRWDMCQILLPVRWRPILPG